MSTQEMPITHPAVIASNSMTSEFAKDDHLGRAIWARDKARAAESTGDLNKAWRYYHEQKQHFLQHAQKNKFNTSQLLALDATVSESLASILRIEGKHHEAMIHVLYWVAATLRQTKVQEKRLLAYFRRCEFKAVSEANLFTAIQDLRNDPQFSEAQVVVGKWIKLL